MRITSRASRTSYTLHENHIAHIAHATCESHSLLGTYLFMSVDFPGEGKGKQRGDGKGKGKNGKVEGVEEKGKGKDDITFKQHCRPQIDGYRKVLTNKLN